MESDNTVTTKSQLTECSGIEPVPPFVDQVLIEWDFIAFFAYDNFESSGRGIVALGEGEKGGEVFYVPQSLADGCHLSVKEIELLEDYDPEYEFLVLFEVPEGTRTVRIRTSGDQRHPKRVWLFEMLRRMSEAPEELPEKLPAWFGDFCERLSQIGRGSNA